MAASTTEDRANVQEAQWLLPAASYRVVLVVRLTGLDSTGRVKAQDLPGDMAARVLEGVNHGV